jgi:sigma-B regulation protein RsbQ
VNPLKRNNVRQTGRPDGPAVVFAHGFGCDHNMWRFVAPEFEESHRVVVFDHVGHGRSASRAYDRRKYATLDGYAQDVVEIADKLGLRGATLVGHSVSATIAMLAVLRARPGVFDRLVMVAPSPRFIDEGDYIGGFTRQDIDDMLAGMDDYPSWSDAMAPFIMGNPERPELTEELATSFCRTDEQIARDFARVTFLSDHRAELGQVTVPTLVIQALHDPIAPVQVGEYVHAAIPGSVLRMLDAAGHCPNLSAPLDTTEAIADFLGVAAFR